MEQLSQLSLTAFDVIVVAVLALSALMGLVRGMVREAVGIASWVAALAVAIYAFDQVRPLLDGMVTPPLLADLLTAAAVFFIPLILFKLLGSMLASGVDNIGLGFIDRLGGLAFGIARGAFLVVAAYLLASMLIPVERMPPWVQEARLRPEVERGAVWLREMLPDSLAEQTRRASEGLLGPGGAVTPGGSGVTPSDRQQLDQLFQRSN